MRKFPGLLALLVLCATSQLHAEARVDKNVIYGMYSGLALLMDVHRPATPNGWLAGYAPEEVTAPGPLVSVL